MIGVLAKLRASHGHLDGLWQDDLFPHVQDHYGGLAATEIGARGSDRKRIAGGRFLRRTWWYRSVSRPQYGAKVTGIELTPSRVSGAYADIYNEKNL